MGLRPHVPPNIQSAVGGKQGRTVAYNRLLSLRRILASHHSRQQAVFNGKRSPVPSLVCLPRGQG